MRQDRSIPKLLSLLAVMTTLSLVSHQLFVRFGRRRLVPVAQIDLEAKLKYDDASVRLIDRGVHLPTVCLNVTCKDAYVKHLQLEGKGGSLYKYPVPPLRHLLWQNENVSAYFVQQLRTWRQVHPDWTVVLWRDQDLRPFVSKHFPSALRRFVELGTYPIMQVDMVRYMLLFKYGGVYADLDYSLSASLDAYRRFYAVVTREPELHSLQNLGFQWPPKPMASPAFMMSAPGHSFFRYCVELLQKKPFVEKEPATFAGPYALSYMLEDYARAFPVANRALETVYMPPSYSFHRYENNRLNTSRSAYMQQRMDAMRGHCRGVQADWAEQLRQFCTDPNNMDPITDRTQPVVAVHDLKKSGAVYDGIGAKFYFENVEHVGKVFGPRLQLGRNWL